jgi:hypothetical protein
MSVIPAKQEVELRGSLFKARLGKKKLARFYLKKQAGYSSPYL